MEPLGLAPGRVPVGRQRVLSVYLPQSYKLYLHVYKFALHTCKLYLHACKFTLHTCKLYLHACKLYLHACKLTLHACELYLPTALFGPLLQKQSPLLPASLCPMRIKPSLASPRSPTLAGGMFCSPPACGGSWRGAILVLDATIPKIRPPLPLRGIPPACRGEV